MSEHNPNLGGFLICVGISLIVAGWSLAFLLPETQDKLSILLIFIASGIGLRIIDHGGRMYSHAYNAACEEQERIDEYLDRYRGMSP